MLRDNGSAHPGQTARNVLGEPLEICSCSHTNISRYLCNDLILLLFDVIASSSSILRDGDSRRSSSLLATSRAPPTFIETSIPVAIHRRAVRSDIPVSRAMSPARRYSWAFVIRDPQALSCRSREPRARWPQIQRQPDVPVGAPVRSAHLPMQIGCS